MPRQPVHWLAALHSKKGYPVTDPFRVNKIRKKEEFRFSADHPMPVTAHAPVYPRTAGANHRGRYGWELADVRGARTCFYGWCRRWPITVGVTPTDRRGTQWSHMSCWPRMAGLAEAIKNRPQLLIKAHRAKQFAEEPKPRFGQRRRGPAATESPPSRKKRYGGNGHHENRRSNSQCSKCARNPLDGSCGLSHIAPQFLAILFAAQEQLLLQSCQIG